MKTITIKFETHYAGTWYEKIGDKVVQIESQAKVTSLPDDISDAAITNPGKWYEVDTKRLKKVKVKRNEAMWI